jgi:small subunit ribosomal protein S6
MFLIDSGRYAQDPQGTENTIREYLERCEAEIVGMAPWQEGKLAYEINGHRKGLHLLTFFKMDGSQAENLNRICKLSDLVIRYLLLEHEPKLFELMTQQGPPEAEEEEAEQPTGEPAAAGS